jgi:hypothetical protein
MSARSPIARADLSFVFPSVAAPHSFHLCSRPRCSRGSNLLFPEELYASSRPKIRISGSSSNDIGPSTLSLEKVSCIRFLSFRQFLQSNSAWCTDFLGAEHHWQACLLRAYPSQLPRVLSLVDNIGRLVIAYHLWSARHHCILSPVTVPFNFPDPLPWLPSSQDYFQPLVSAPGLFNALFERLTILSLLHFQVYFSQLFLRPGHSLRCLPVTL